MQKFSKDPATLAKLSPEQYRVTQQCGTEMPGTGAYLHNKEPGIYVDVVSDESHGMIRTEVRSAQGDSHLGHVFTERRRKAAGLT